MYSTDTMHRLAHRLRTIGAVAGLALAPLHTASAQDITSAPTAPASSSARAWGVRFTSGALIPTGAQRDALSSAQLSAVGLSWRVARSLDVTGGFSWARSRAVDLIERPRLDVFTSDLGLELRTGAWSPNAVVRARPFLGAGGGVRTYNARSAGVDATHHAAAYVAAGSDIGLGRVGVRIEARDYATRQSAAYDVSTRVLRNDVVISASLSVKKRRAPQH